METSIPSFVSALITAVRSRPFVTDKVTATTWPSGAPFFFHGSPLEIQSQIKDLGGVLKQPCIFLIEFIEDEINLDRTKNVGASPKLKMFFMDKYNEEYTIDQQYTNVIDVMDELVREFIAVCQRNRYILRMFDYGTIRHSKWGIYRKDKGNLTPIFSEKLSGVELNVTLDIDKILDITCSDTGGVGVCATLVELLEVRTPAQIEDALEDAGVEEAVKDLICEPVTVRNSDSTFSEEVTHGQTLVLDDYDIDVYLNAVLIDSDTAPAMTDIIINIS